MALSADTVDAEMAADWARILEEHAVEAEPAPKEPADEQKPLETPDETPARARDDSGKFVKQEKVDAAKAATQVEGKAAAEKAAEPRRGTEATGAADVPDQLHLSPAAAPDSVRDINRPPSTWKPTARAEFDKLPPAVKAEVHRREADFMQGQNQLLPDARFGRSVNQVIEPYRMLIQQAGGTPERAIADLLHTAATFRVGTPQEKLEALRGIATQYGIDPRHLVDGAPAQPQQSAFQDPRVDQLLAQMNAERQANQAREQTQLETAVTSWMNESVNGQPKRPYLGDVMQQMSALVPQIRQTNPSLPHTEVLQQAYDTATWGNPEIRPLLQQQEAQRTEQTRASDNQNRVREAKRAASVNVPRRASTPSAGKPGTLDETLSETARELGLIT